MVRKNQMLMVLALSTIVSAATGQVELKGTVKDGTGKAIEGAIVSLTKKALKDTTDSKGEFNVTDITVGTLQQQGSERNEINFCINGHKVLFTLTSKMEDVSMSIISANGQKVFGTSFDSKSLSNSEIPQLKSGVYLVKLTSGSQQVVQKIITSGDQLIFSNHGSIAASGSSAGLRLASAGNVDTIVASKSGYVTKMVPVDSYKKSGIAIVIEKEPVGPVTCKLSDLPASSALKENKKLPNPFAFFDGTEITKKSEWPCLRKEILNMAYKYMYGQMPPFESPDVEVEGSVSGSGVTAKVSYKGKSATINFGTSGSGDILLISMGSGLGPGSKYKFRTFSVDNTKANSWASTCKTLFGMSPCGEISIAWGCNILCRAIAADPDGGIDTNKIMTTGCSNTAKAAFLAAVFCEGIDLAVVVESGGFGDASPRVAEYLYKGPGPWKCNDPPQGLWKPDYGDQWLAAPYMDPNVASWVINNNSGNVYKLPFDTHMLMACVAPRYLCVLSNSNGPNSWCHLNGTGSAIAAWAAKPVFNALGVPENFAFNIPSAYSHCTEAQKAHGTLVDEFFKRVFDGDKNAKTDVMNIPASNVQLDPSKWESIWVDWDMDTKLD